MDHVAAGCITQFELLDAESRVALVRQVLDICDTIPHPHHTFIGGDTPMRQEVRLEGLVHGIEYGSHFVLRVKVDVSTWCRVLNADVEYPLEHRKSAVRHHTSEVWSNLRRVAP